MGRSLLPPSLALVAALSAGAVWLWPRDGAQPVHPAGTEVEATATRPAVAATAASASARVPGPVPDATGAVTAPTVTVYKSPTCGCCNKWIEHLEANGYDVVAHDVRDLNAVKRQLGIAPALASCHTAIVDDYLVEGHVPADVIGRLLEERPAIAGIAVPGMPMGSPGMEGPYSEPYDVLAFDRAGKISVFDRR